MPGGAVLKAKLGIETVHRDEKGIWLVQFVPPWSKVNYWEKNNSFLTNIKSLLWTFLII